jgi:hypothetical protein
MYAIIQQIIDHVYQGSNGYGDQQYIYYICCALIPLFAVVFIDLIRDIFRGFFRG